PPRAQRPPARPPRAPAPGGPARPARGGGGPRDDRDGARAVQTPPRRGRWLPASTGVTMLHRYRPLLVVLLLAAASAHAQQGLTPYHVAQLHAVGDAITSEDGDLVAYTVSIPADPLEANEPARSELHVYRLADDTDRVVLTAEVDPGSIRWVPDAEQHQISYLARGEGDEATALYAVEAATGVVRRVVGFE